MTVTPPLAFVLPLEALTHPRCQCIDATIRDHRGKEVFTRPIGLPGDDDRAVKTILEGRGPLPPLVLVKAGRKVSKAVTETF